jgi:hypothetical protein
MNESYTASQLRWIAVRVFVAPPALFVLAGIVLLVSNAGLRSAPFLAQLAAGLGAEALTAYLLTPAFSPLCRQSVIAGSIFGIVVCFTGGLAFGLTAGLVYPDFSFRAFVLRPMFWFAICGFPVAALAGLLFSGAAQRTAPPAQTDATNGASS